MIPLADTDVRLSSLVALLLFRTTNSYDPSTYHFTAARICAAVSYNPETNTGLFASSVSMYLLTENYIYGASLLGPL